VRHRVFRLRREAGIGRGGCNVSASIEHHKTAAPAPDLLVRRFVAPSPNRIWAGDMTFIRTEKAGYRYILLDLFSRKVVGWAMDQRPGQVLHLGARKWRWRSAARGQASFTTPIGTAVQHASLPGIAAGAWTEGKRTVGSCHRITPWPRVSSRT
jgi:transposase InsO family protein